MQAPSTDPRQPSIPLLHIDGAVATITLNRPAHRNRLHNEDLHALLAHCAAIAAATSVRVAVLRANTAGQPQPVFSAGYHLAQEDKDRAADQFEAVVDAIEQLRVPVIAAVGGSVYGGATDMVLASDLAIGVEGMEMRMPATAIGLHYYASGVVRYVSRLGVVNAKRAFLTAETFSGADLLAMGFVQALVPPQQLEATVRARVEAVCALAPQAVQSMKDTLNRVARGGVDWGLMRHRHRVSQTGPEFAEGQAAFKARRPANF
jgi:enoyl-CoA hydratase/carnithine racemase